MYQKVWHICDGYVDLATIYGVFRDKWGHIKYAFKQFEYSNDEKYNVGSSYCHDEDQLFPTKEALIKHIKEIKEEDYD